jgi:mercuric ion binding protein
MHLQQMTIKDEAVETRIRDRSATVTYDDANADVSQLTSATTNAGYPSTPQS